MQDRERRDERGAARVKGKVVNGLEEEEEMEAAEVKMLSEVFSGCDQDRTGSGRRRSGDSLSN